VFVSLSFQKQQERLLEGVHLKGAQSLRIVAASPMQAGTWKGSL
jgi:hypothetical protein